MIGRRVALLALAGVLAFDSAGAQSPDAVEPRPPGWRGVVDDALERIVPGHDPLLFERHRSWTEGINPTAEIHLADGDYSRVDAARC